MRRRQYLKASAVALAGLAGCSGGTDGGGSGDGVSTEEKLKSEVRELYTTLYEDHSIEDANALYHPENPSDPLVAENFEPYGGVEKIESDIAKIEIVDQSENTARVHAVVNYSTPVGSAVNTDWFVLRKHEGEWMINMWLPQSARTDLPQEAVEAAMAANRSSA